MKTPWQRKSKVTSCHRTFPSLFVTALLTAGFVVRRKARISTWAALCLLAGCATQPADQLTRAEEEMRDVRSRQPQPAVDNTAPQQVPPAVTQRLLSTGSDRNAGETERFNLSVSQMPARAFFLSLVNGTDINLVVHPEVEGMISLDLNNVTVSEVLEVTRTVFGYEFSVQNGIYTIHPRKLSTQVFPIDYLDVRRVGVSDTAVQVGSTGSSDGNNNGRSQSSGGGDQANLLGYANEGGSGSSGGQGSGFSTGSRVQTLNATDFWRQLQISLEAIIDVQQADRMVSVNAQTGVVVVRALPNELRAVREFLDKSQLSVRRQVILETKIVEVRLREGFEAGINWGAINGQVLLDKNVTQWEAPTNITGISEQMGEVFASLIRVGDITELLSLLETQGHVQVLSSPRVSTVNNQKAVIRVGSDEYFVTGISNSTTTSAATTTSAPNIELSSFFSGIALDVTPQIAEDGDVILHIHPVVSDVNDQLKELTVGNEKFSLPLALRDIRESDSIVRAQNGQVVVLGGLMQEITRENNGERPWVGKVPVLNWLFKTEDNNKVKTELVILMRPIVVDERSFERDIDQSNERIRQMGDQYRSQF